MTSSLLRGAVAKPLERTAELQQLSAVVAAGASGRGQVCVIEGPSGVGKSRLLDECARSAQTLDMSVLRARCSELTRDYPYGVARNLFETMLVRADARTRGDLMRGPAALAEPVFGNGEDADEFGVLHGLYWLTVNLAEQGPTAILVAELPWADGSKVHIFLRTPPTASTIWAWLWSSRSVPGIQVPSRRLSITCGMRPPHHRFVHSSSPMTPSGRCSVRRFRRMTGMRVSPETSCARREETHSLSLPSLTPYAPARAPGRQPRNLYAATSPAEWRG